MPQGKRNEDSKINQISAYLVKRFEILDNILRFYLGSDTNLPSNSPGTSRPPVDHADCICVRTSTSKYTPQKTIDLTTNNREQNRKLIEKFNRMMMIDDCNAFGQHVAHKLENLDPTTAYNLEQKIIKVLLGTEVEKNNISTQYAFSPALYSQDKPLYNNSIQIKPNKLNMEEQEYIHVEPNTTTKTYLETATYFNSHKQELEKSDPHSPEISEARIDRMSERQIRISITSTDKEKTEEVTKDFELIQEPLSSYIDNLSLEKNYKFIDMTGPFTFKSEEIEFDRRRRFISFEVFDTLEIGGTSAITLDLQGSSQQLLSQEKDSKEKLTRRERKRRRKAKQQQDDKKKGKN